MGKRKVRNVAAELTRRKAASLANWTKGRARCLDPDRVYDRKQDKRDLRRAD